MSDDWVPPTTIVVNDASGDVVPVLRAWLTFEDHVTIAVFPDVKKDNTHGMEAFVSRGAARRFANMLLAMTDEA